MNEKIGFAAFIPYRKTQIGYEFYLQKRDVTAKLNPGLFGTFGGHMEEGESPTETLRREIMEELRYQPKKEIYFSKYETAIGIIHFYIEEVGADFESQVEVHEGEYGTFLTSTEIEFSRAVSLLAQLIVLQLNTKLNA